ncbi:unnamed protein product [Ciceribacter selenitireducens ATCC BAA-1503]|uniref:Uncharacterized protein n=1 Tax=Ciceribacter selenitireducens ATCC BAA-1503 TaxID=1336235 RepID=A0A376A943_9HYPH|nr:unnamed protein product [Ciceribacter selenitireducens ATCC BAA-1503]
MPFIDFGRLYQADSDGGQGDSLVEPVQTRRCINAPRRGSS